MSQVDISLFLSIVQNLCFLFLNFYGIFFLYFFDYFIIIYKLEINLYLKLFQIIFFILKSIKQYSNYIFLKNLK